MGFISTVASFGIGYAAGMVTGRQGMERLSGRVRGSSSSQGSGDAPMMDVRELRQVMTTPPDAVRKTASLQEAALLMKTKDIGDVLVEDEQGLLAGIITDRDIAIPDGFGAGCRSDDAIPGRSPLARGGGRKGRRDRLAGRHLSGDGARLTARRYQRGISEPLSSRRSSVLGGCRDA